MCLLMMLHIGNWFTGFTLIQLKENYNVPNIEILVNASCPVTKTQDSLLYADCTHLTGDIEKIPTTLDKDIQILNISATSISMLEEDDLVPYTKIIELVMSNLKLAYFSSEFLMPIKNLQKLNMSETPLGQPVVKLPETIKILIIDSVTSEIGDAIDLDLYSLISLEEISLVGNYFQSIPHLNPNAPITWINLRENSIVNLDYRALAPFCKLQKFNIDKFVSGSQYVNKCCGVMFWLQEYSINSELRCGKPCVKDEHFEFSQEAIDRYNECLNIHANVGMLENLLEILKTIILPSALIFTFLFLVLKFYRSAAVRSHRQNKTTLAEAEVEEEQEYDDNKKS